MAVEWVVGIAVLCLLVGFGLARLIGAGGNGKAKVAELETALEDAQEELSNYRREVYGQFSETADKFRALDESYHALHRQLAQSAVALCGDAPTPLLESPAGERLIAEAQTAPDAPAADPGSVADDATAEATAEALEVAAVEAAAREGTAEEATTVGLDGVPEPGLGVTDTIVVSEGHESASDANADDAIPTLVEPQRKAQAVADETSDDESVKPPGRSTG